MLNSVLHCTNTGTIHGQPLAVLRPCAAMLFRVRHLTHRLSDPPPDDIHEYLLMTSGVMDPANPFGVVLVTTPEMSRIPSHSVEYITKCKAYTPYRQALDYAQSLIEMVTPSDNLGATHR